ncbi:hypothetical protein FO519_010009 [Halicephalobus sp. NKZ332]|nr:hypothetical protein FO519_010009 [Halicephalobus sp. NKZ332]
MDALNHKEIEERILEACTKTDVIIVEGNMISEVNNIVKLTDHIVFITMDRDSCEKRRKTRSYELARLPGYFDQIVWPSYLSHYETAKRLETQGVSISFQSGTDPLDDVIQRTLMAFEKKLRCFIRIQSSQIDMRKLEHFVTLPNCGAISTFIETTRNNFKDKKVISLEYECSESTTYEEIRKICQETRKKFLDIERIAIVHRIGKIGVGESSIAIVTSSPHRKEAIEATSFLIDMIKSCVPIFKKEIYEDGSNS